MSVVSCSLFKNCFQAYLCHHHICCVCWMSFTLVVPPTLKSSPAQFTRSPKRCALVWVHQQLLTPTWSVARPARKQALVSVVTVVNMVLALLVMVYVVLFHLLLVAIAFPDTYPAFLTVKFQSPIVRLTVNEPTLAMQLCDQSRHM